MTPARSATTADAATIADTLARAFVADPALAHIFPDAATRPERLRRFFALIVRAEPELAHGFVADGAAALWRPPGGWRTPTATMVRLLPYLLHAFGTALPRALRLQAALERHHPAPPHWYLAFVGSAPEHRGKGAGGAVIRAGLARADAAGLPCALETATESNLPIYRAYGFAITDRFAAAPGLKFWEMWREPART